MNTPLDTPIPEVMSEAMSEAMSELFRVLGHPARVRVVSSLVEGPASVRELQARMHVDGSRLSQQLAVLRRAGLVSARRRGRSIDYALATPEVIELIRAARWVVNRRAASQEQLLAQLQMERAS